MEAEIVPMCEDQGLGIVPWAALGGGQLQSSNQRKEKERKEKGQKSYYSLSPQDIAVCDMLEKIATDKKTTLQSIVSLSSRHQ
jgi:aryl-alcohol dehydrogenase-like predicted oxidoreductase